MDWTKLFFRNRKHNNLLRSFKKIEPIINEIFAPGNRFVGKDYFQFIGQKSCEVAAADYLMIGKFDAKEQSIKSLVYCSKNEVFNNISYHLYESPCKQVFGNKVYSIKEGAGEHFSSNAPFADAEVEGYIGIPLFNSSNEPIGIIVALFKNPIRKHLKTIESLLYLFTSRLSTEIEHLQAKEDIKKRNGELELMHRALKDKNKKLDYSVAKMRKAQLKSKEYDQLKSTFLANLSHEIRTPMNVILGFMELLKSDSLTVEEREEYVEIINFNGLQLLKVMDDLIDISKLQTRLLQEEFSRLHLNDLMSKVHKHFTKQVALLKKDLSINFFDGLEDGKDIIVTDEDGLTKVLKHLLDNALKFTRDGGIISFGYELQGYELLFFVKDNGVGVQAGKEDVIFDMFRQGQDDMKREFGGNGLGLAISKKYIETLGGKIWLDKKYVNGARFCFSIPFEPSKARKASIKKQPLTNQYL